MKDQKIVAQISTHKVVKENGKFWLFEKGLDLEGFLPNGEPAFTEDQKLDPMWIEMSQDRRLRIIEHKDDILCIMDGLEETNRILVAEANAEFKSYK